MKILGIIAEYNPIHNGHIYHLEKSKVISKADFIIAVISGNWTQRGEPAVLDKWTRAKVALEIGVDLVLEMPVAFALNSAEYFALGGVKVLNGLGLVDYISFGIEDENIDTLKSIANIFDEEPVKFKEILKEFLDKGNSFPKSRQLATEKLLGIEVPSLRKPNNILAIEYLKALKALNSKIIPIGIKRNGAGHIESATKIREYLSKGDFDIMQQFVSTKTAMEIKLNGFCLATLDNACLFNEIRGILLRENIESLKDIFAIGEGLEYKLKKEVRYAKNLNDLVNRVKSKRYTETRILRVLMEVLIGLTNSAYRYSKTNFQTKVLAFNDNGRKILKKMKSNGLNSIPVITNSNKEGHLDPLDVRATDMYNLIVGKDLYLFSEYVKTPQK